MDSSAHPARPTSHPTDRSFSKRFSAIGPQAQAATPEPIGLADSPDGLQGLSGFQLHETVTRHLHSRRYNAALLTLAAGEPTDRQASWFWHLQGEALANLGRYHDALTSFDRALEIDPTKAESLVFQAVCYVHLQDYAQALARCDRALELSPYHTQAWLFRGVALQRLGRYQEAYCSYEHATHPHHPIARRRRPLHRAVQRGLTYYRRLTQVCRRWLSQAL